MKTLSIQLTVVLAALAACALQAQAQPRANVARVRPLYSVPSDYYGYAARPHHYRHDYHPGYYRRGAGTAWGGYAQGIAAMTNAQGQYNRLTAEARVIHAEAARMEVENRELAADTFFAMRQANKQARAALRGPQPTPQQIAERARQAAPDRLSDNQLEAASGELSWPILLQTGHFAGLRAELQTVFTRRAANGGLQQPESLRARQTADAMETQLNSLVREVYFSDFSEAQRFLRSLAYEIQLPVI